jgi:hypothetical protein
MQYRAKTKQPGFKTPRRAARLNLLTQQHSSDQGPVGL